MDFLYALLLLSIFVSVDVGLARGLLPRAVSHRFYLFLVQGMVPLSITLIILVIRKDTGALEILRLGTLVHYASLTMMAQVFTDPAWCILLGLNPLNPYGDWRYPKVPVPTYLFIALRLLPASVSYYLSTTDGWIQAALRVWAIRLRITKRREALLSLVLIILLLSLSFIFPFS